MSQFRVRRACSRGRAALLFVLALFLLVGGCGSGDEARRAVPPGIRLPEVGTLGRVPRGPGTIIVDVTADGHITLDGKGPLSLLALREELERLTADPEWREPDRTSLRILHIRADASLPWTVATWILQTAADPGVMLYRTFFGAQARRGGAVGAIGCALPKDGPHPGHYDWIVDTPRLTVRVVPRDETPSEPEDLLAPLRAAADDHPLSDVRLALSAPARQNGEIPTGFMIQLVDVALRAGVRDISFEGAPLSRAFEPDDVQGLLDHVAGLRERMGSPVLRVDRKVVPPLPSSEDIPPERGRLTHLHGFGVEKEEPRSNREAERVVLNAAVVEEEIEEETEEEIPDEPFVEEPVIKDEELEDYEETLGAEGLVDAPFVGPPAVLAKLRTAFPSRGREGERENAVETALRWLLAHQAPNGAWQAAGFGRWCHGKEVQEADRVGGVGRAVHDVGTTGLALCAFLGAGYTNRGRHPYAKAVAKGLRYLKSMQSADGCFGPRTDLGWVYDHAAATLAMVEAYGMTHSPIFKGSARKALEFTLSCRNPDGAWGYGVRSGGSATSPTGWMAMPLVIAQWIDDEAERREKTPPFGLDLTTAFDDTFAWLEHDQATTPVAILLRILLGEDPHASDTLQAAAARLAARPPSWDDEEMIDPVVCYFASLALHQVGGEPWGVWDAALRDLLHATQRRDGEPCRYEGSWDSSGAWGAERGRVAATALLTMCLEVDYRYTRVFGIR